MLVLPLNFLASVVDYYGIHIPNSSVTIPLTIFYNSGVPSHEFAVANFNY